MRIEFDSNNAGELTAVFVAIAVLRGGDMSLPLLEEMTANDSGEAPLGRPFSESDTVLPQPPAAVTTPAPLAPPPAAASPAVPPPPVGITVPPAPSPALATDTDSEGLPWDKRIHSTPASKKKDGAWRGKRGLDEATRAAVTAELKQAMGAPPPVVLPDPAVIPPPMFEESAPGVPLPTEPPADAATAFGAGVATPAPSVPPPPAAAVPAPPPAAGPVTDFAGLMRKITGLQSGGHLTVEGTTQIATSLGISGVRDLMVRPDLIPSFDALLPVVG